MKYGSPEWEALMKEKREAETQDGRKYAAARFGIPIEEVVWHNSGICYDRCIVTTEAAAAKVRAAVKGDTANGGWYDGMTLGGFSRDADGNYDVMC